MFRLFDKRVLAVALLACAVAACDDDTTPTGPTETPPPTTATFTGTVTQNGASSHPFEVPRAGAVTATLKAIGPDNTLAVSFAIGNWTNDSCVVVLANDRATGGTVLSGTMTAAGSLCARVSDVGNIAAGATATYTIEVVHP